ncbi:MAG: hypothetical protein ACOZE5_06035 [Verrucomicrobiota bacterium]
METPLQKARRLLTALEELSARETILIRTMEFVEAVALQERAAPLVEALCALAGDPEAAALRPRVASLLGRCGQNYHFLDTQLARLHGELQRVTEARGRLRRVAPAYKTASPAAESQLNTAA